MKLGVAWLYVLSKYGFPPNINGVLKGMDDIARLGFEFCELESVGETNFEEIYKAKAQISAKADECGLTFINYIAVLPDLVSNDSQKRNHALSIFSRAVELASELNCEVIQSDSFLPPLEIMGNPLYDEDISFERTTHIRVPMGFNWSSYWSMLVDVFSACSEIADKYGLKFALEPRVGETLSTTDSLLRLIDQVPSNNLGVVLDIAHLYAQKEILPLSIHKLGERIFHVHLADNDSTSNRHAAPGDGTVDWEGVFSSLEDIAYDGYYMLDIGKIPDEDSALLKGKSLVESYLL
jgi:sugar phosphate isomerase/epimerase